VEEDEGEGFESFEAGRGVEVGFGDKVEQLVVESLPDGFVKVCYHDGETGLVALGQIAMDIVLGVEGVIAREIAKQKQQQFYDSIHVRIVDVLDRCGSSCLRIDYHDPCSLDMDRQHYLLVESIFEQFLTDEILIYV
jgi:hypothetical protein